MSHRIRGAGYLALAALFALMLPLLVACGGENTSATQAPAAPAAGTTPTTAAAPAAGTTTAAAAPAGQPTTAAAQSAAGSPAASGQAGGYPSGGQFSTLEQVGKKGGRVVEVAFGDARTTNPMLSSDTASGDRIAMMFNALVDLNPDTGLPFPDLAAEVPSLDNGGISKDGLTYTFKLRPNVKWHDGQPLTAKDVVYTYQTMMKKETGSPRTSELTERVESVTASDDATVVFKLKKVVAPFLTDNMYRIVPEHILGKVAVDQIKAHPFSTGDPAQTIGTGPFKFKEWVKDDHATLVKNSAYFRGEPALDEYVFRVVKDANVVVANLKTAEGDFGSITPSFFEEMSAVANLNIARYDTYSVTYYVYQLDQSKTTVFQDKRVRQALLYALDREAMVKAIAFGFHRVAVGTEPILSWANAPDQIQLKYPYDLKKAEQLLDEAGWKKGADGIRAKDGQRLSFTLWTNAGNKVREQYVTVMQQQWKALGVDATPKTEEWNAFLARLNETHDFDAYLSGFVFGVDPDQSSFWTCDAYTGGFNRAKYCNKRVDELFAQGLTELDQAKRKQLYIEAQNILLDELPTVMLDFPQGLAAVNKRVHNLKPNAINVRWNAHTWWVDDRR